MPPNPRRSIFLSHSLNVAGRKAEGISRKLAPTNLVPVRAQSRTRVIPALIKNSIGSIVVPRYSIYSTKRIGLPFAHFQQTRQTVNVTGTRSDNMMPLSVMLHTVPNKTFITGAF
jgi:hypothetical protein